jgi:CheY-like chemotaxis protein
MLEILLVEDDMSHAKLFQRMLKRYDPDMPLHFARNGLEALSFLETYYANPNGSSLAVALDINMPQLDGLKMLEQVRANPTLTATQVIVISTKDDASVIIKARELGITQYIVKPIAYERIKAALDELLR